MRRPVAYRNRTWPSVCCNETKWPWALAEVHMLVPIAGGENICAPSSRPLPRAVARPCQLPVLGTMQFRKRPWALKIRPRRYAARDPWYAQPPATVLTPMFALALPSWAALEPAQNQPRSPTTAALRPAGHAPALIGLKIASFARREELWVAVGALNRVQSHHTLVTPSRLAVSG